MEQYFGFRNFRQFERTRREIRLPYDLLNDVRFRQLPDARKAHLICLLLLSARMNNLLPNHRLKLERTDRRHRDSGSLRTCRVHRVLATRTHDAPGSVGKPTYL